MTLQGFTSPSALKARRALSGHEGARRPPVGPSPTENTCGCQSWRLKHRLDPDPHSLVCAVWITSLCRYTPDQSLGIGYGCGRNISTVFHALLLNAINCCKLCTHENNQTCNQKVIKYNAFLCTLQRVSAASSLNHQLASDYRHSVCNYLLAVLEYTQIQHINETK